MHSSVPILDVKSAKIGILMFKNKLRMSLVQISPTFLSNFVNNNDHENLSSRVLWSSSKDCKARQRTSRCDNACPENCGFLARAGSGN